MLRDSISHIYPVSFKDINDKVSIFVKEYCNTGAINIIGNLSMAA